MLIEELVQYFATKTNLPKKIKIAPAVTITDITVFLNGHLEFVKTHGDKNVYYDRLMMLKTALDEA